MSDLVTWILVGLIAGVVSTIVVSAATRSIRRRRLEKALGESPSRGESQPDTGAIGDRSDILHRARRRF
jgi:hypothetical protein